MATQIDKAAQEATRADAHDRTPPAADANGQALATALDTHKRPQPTAEPATVAGVPERVLATFGHYNLLEELAVGAQFNLPYIHVVVNNSYLGLIRQSQRGFNMEQNVSLAFENINSPGARHMPWPLNPATV